MTRPARGRVSWPVLVAGIGLVGPAVLAVFGLLPVWVAVVYALASLAAFAAYAADKAQAAVGRRRVPERTLHLLALAGGWPGALLAQRHFRHKTQKARFQVLFWATVVAHAVVIGWWVLH